MKLVKKIFFALLCLFGCSILPTVRSLNTIHNENGDDGDFNKCADGSDLFDPPECPDQDPTLPVYFPFPYDCTQYYECTNGIARCIKCATGTVWDQANLICNHPAAVNCTIITTSAPTSPTTTTEPTTTTPTTTTPTTTTPTTTTPTTTTPTTTTTTEPTTTTTTSTEPPTTTTEDPVHWICPEGYVGLMRHPYDCGLFYNCDPGRRPCLFECQTGLYFNPLIGACDHKYNVPDCLGGTPPPPTNIPSGTHGSSLNYRNVNRVNIAQNVQFVANFLRNEKSGELSDPCQAIRSYLQV